ncbi:hypothetical protein EDC94DRAFT_515866 [Helicostylum pulchrum]|nr:hypothetical protein EDC94DRAFT_515866 [Helicostylum pulchrum]
MTSCQYCVTERSKLNLRTVCSAKKESCNRYFGCNKFVDVLDREQCDENNNKTLKNYASYINNNTARCSNICSFCSSLFWGLIVVSPFVCCIALSMAEVISSYPLEGGVYSWTLLLCNKEWGPFMSYINGYISLIGFVTTTITLAYSVTNFIVYTVNILNEDQITSPGTSIGIYCAIFIIATGYNLLGMRYSSYLNIFLGTCFTKRYICIILITFI